MRESPLPPALRWLGPLLAAGYGVGAGLHRAVASSRFAPLATLCVGNLTVGGTGKTPAVKYVARELARRGRKPAVLMRGYKAQGSDEGREMDAALADLGIPIFVNSDRFASVLRAREQGRDVAVLDDGFQHWRLKRDLDIVLIDATDPFSGDRLLPYGRLREPPRGLARAGAVIVTRSDAVPPGDLAALDARIRNLAPSAALAHARHHPAALRPVGRSAVGIAAAPWPLERLKGLRVLGACGIGNPEGFRRTLGALGANLVAFREFQDHHAYTRPDLLHLLRAAADARAEAVLVTEKDAVKLAPLLDAETPAHPILALEVRFEIVEGESAVWNAVDAALAAAARRIGQDPTVTQRPL